MMDLDSFTWPASQLAEAVEILARRAKFEFTPPAETMPALNAYSEEAMQQWLEAAASRLGLEVEAVTTSYRDVYQLIRKAGPALLQVSGADEPRFLLLVKSGPWRARLIKPDLTVQSVAIEHICSLMRQSVEAPVVDTVAQMLATAQIAEQRREQAKQAILNEQLSGVQLGGCWLLRLSPASDFRQQLRQQRVPRQLFLLLGAHALQQGLQILGWWIIVQGVLTQRFDSVWLFAWGLVLLTSIPFELLVVWLQSLLTVGLGSLFKQRLLFGTLQLHPEEIRHQGIGQFLGRVLEADTVETMMLGGGFAALIASIELFAALIILNLGAGGWWHAALLLLWLAVTLFLSWRYYRHSGAWRSSHRHMITSLIERMVGHRTRLAQEDPARRHDDEDQSLASYLQLSKTMDGTAIQLTGVINRGWLILGLLGLAYPLINSTIEPALIAVSIGGVMLASQGLNTLINGMDSIVGVLNAWKQIGPLFYAATRNRGEISVDPLLKTGGVVKQNNSNEQPLLVARDLVFRYRDYGQPILQGCNLRINPGDRLLLEGSSGGGKSTLAALLTGLRIPTSGLLLLHGLDRQTLGSAAWRKRIVSAPQFHENHVMAETFAFNLLMGRRWPPSAEDLREAETICRELGLGDLLERMPAGLQQQVGESGWQLSHGERSRLFIARALLQRADMIVLDESFAALDPENLQRALRCVLDRAPTLLVIAHP